MNANFARQDVVPRISGGGGLWRPPCLTNFWVFLRGDGGGSSVGTVSDEELKAAGGREQRGKGRGDLGALKALREATVLKTVEVEEEIWRVERETEIAVDESSTTSTTNPASAVSSWVVDQTLLTTDPIVFPKKKLLATLQSLIDTHHPSSDTLTAIYTALEATPDTPYIPSSELITSNAEELFSILESAVKIRAPESVVPPMELKGGATVVDAQVDGAKLKARIAVLKKILSEIDDVAERVGCYKGAEDFGGVKEELGGLWEKLDGVAEVVKEKRKLFETKVNKEVEGLEGDIAGLEAERVKCQEEIRELRKKVEEKVRHVSDVTTEIKKKRKICQSKQRTAEGIRSHLDDLQHTISLRIQECRAAIDIASAFQTAASTTTQLCSTILSTHQTTASTLLSESTSNIQSTLLRHWELLFSARGGLVSDLRGQKRALLAEKANLRVQKTQPTHQNIIDLQEKLLLERANAIQRQQQAIHHTEEQLQTVYTEAGLVSDDGHFMAEHMEKFKAVKGETPKIDTLHDILDHLHVAASLKAADADTLEALIETLDHLTYRGETANIQRQLCSDPSLHTSLKLATTLVSNAKEALPMEMAVAGSGRSIPCLLEAALAKMDKLLDVNLKA